MRIVFMGSSGFACPSLECLLGSGEDEVVAVVTQPDRPKGRRLEVSGCPVKQYLGKRSIPVLSPENVNASGSLESLRGYKPDAMVVVAYGQLLKPALLALPRLGCVNVHGSLLPKYRGAAPIQWAIANGETVTGVTTMYIDERMDAGDVILRREVPVGPEFTGGELHDVLAHVGAELLRETMNLLRAGKAPRWPQDEAEATYAPKLSKMDSRLDWNLPATTIHNRVRAFNPWPGCCCEIPRESGMRVKIVKTRVEPSEGRPGIVVEAKGDGILVQAGGGAGLRLLEVQPEGRKPMSGAAFLRGHSTVAGVEVG